MGFELAASFAAAQLAGGKISVEKKGEEREGGKKGKKNKSIPASLEYRRAKSSSGLCVDHRVPLCPPRARSPHLGFLQFSLVLEVVLAPI